MNAFEATTNSLAGARVAVVGRLASMARRDAAKLIRQHGAVLLPGVDESATIVVIAGDELPLRFESGGLQEALPPDVLAAAEAGRIEVVSEEQFWQRLGAVGDEGPSQVRRLYTPGMLAQLLGVPVAVVRRWQRRGLIRPVREVSRLAYFDFQEVATARRLAELLGAGVSPQRIEKQLESLRRVMPDIERPLAQLAVIVEGRDILLRQGDGLIDSAGQMRFDFEPTSPAHDTQDASPSGTLRMIVSGDEEAQAASPDELLQLAAQYDDDGLLDAAEEAYRAALAAGGAQAEVCFQLAELLYRRGDLPAARERYYMAIELDVDYVEARANLGCVLAELGQGELAAAALAGALKHHGEYPDAHFHLARILCDQGRAAEADPHWRAFLDLAPESPWADEARRRLEDAVGSV